MTASKEGEPRYMAFLLRVWREDSPESWRITLENPHSGERHGFRSLQALFAFLEEHMAHPPPSPTTDEDV